MRFDWLANRWVIIAPQRSTRPDDFVTPPVRVQDPSACPFCFGKEGQTPDAVASYGASEEQWQVRVVPNKFPAVSALGNTESFSAVAGGLQENDKIDLFLRRQSTGAHEVIVESPKHIVSVSELDRSQIRLVFQAYIDRLDFWLSQPEINYAVLFKNVGQDAGASLAHTHSQLIATEILPTEVARITERMNLFYEKEGDCLFCRMVQDELEQQTRVVDETPDFLAFCPFASRTPSLINIVPKAHRSRFEVQDDFETEQLSWLTHRVIRRLEKCFPDSSYNFVIHTAPSRDVQEEAFHWRMELFPRVTKVAGFEWGSDCFINPQSPEDAAQQLRGAGV